MRAILLATLANTATAVAVKHQQQPITGPEFPSWEEYLDKYGLSFSASELPERQKLFEQSVADAKKQNANPKATWKATINEFAVKTPEEMTAMMGYMKQTGKAGAPGYAPMVTVSSPPNDFDWRETPGVVTAVKNQGACGSCWAFASTAVMETVIALDTGVLFNLSPQQVTSCTPNPKQCGGSGGCSGATAQLAFNYTIQTGITELWSYPYQSGITSNSEECQPFGGRTTPVAGISAYVQLPQNDAAALLAAVLQSPVSVSVAASTFGLYHSGIFDGCSLERPILNHCPPCSKMPGYNLDHHGVHDRLQLFLFAFTCFRGGILVLLDPLCRLSNCIF